MNKLTAFLESGILELYVMGAATPDERREVEEMAAAHHEVREELDAISQSLEQYAQANAVKPHPTVKYLLLATIDYMERLKKGEQPVTPPELTVASRPEDYAMWLNREDMRSPDAVEEIYVKLIGATPQATTAIVWLKDEAHNEVHHDEYERFLIIEGTCDITVNEQVNHLTPGDYFAIPLHQPHTVKVTSEIPCKVILQRVAA